MVTPDPSLILLGQIAPIDQFIQVDSTCFLFYVSKWWEGKNGVLSNACACKPATGAFVTQYLLLLLIFFSPSCTSKKKLSVSFFTICLVTLIFESIAKLCARQYMIMVDIKFLEGFFTLFRRQGRIKYLGTTCEFSII